MHLRLLLPVALLALAGPLAARSSSEQGAPQESRPEAGQHVEGVSDRAPPDRIAPLLDGFWDRWVELHPTEATILGETRGRDRLTIDLTGEHRDAVRELYDATLEQLRRYDATSVRDLERTWLEAGEILLSDQRALLERPERFLPLQPLGGMPGVFLQLGSGDGAHPFDTEDDYRDFLRRAEDLPRWVEAALRRLDEGLASGITHPRSVVDLTLVRLRSATSVRSPRDSVLWQPMDRLPAGILGAERAALEGDWEGMIEKTVLPALRRLEEYLGTRYRPGARTTLSMSALPGGDAWYRDRVRFFTGTDLSPEEIFTLGENEVARIQGEMEALRREVLRTEAMRQGVRPSRVGLGTLAALRGRMLGGPRGVVVGEKAAIAAYRDVLRRVEPGLGRLFHRLPKTPLEIRPVEAHRAATAPGAFYERGLPDGSRPGVFYVNLSGGGVRAATVAALFLHEGLPGHHLQLARAAEAEGIPTLLRRGYAGAFIEGWGLYAESLGDELGVYDDAASRYGRLDFELGRAARLIADVGIHTRGWTAVEARRELERRGLDWAVREIGRYTALPGQALGYKVGELEILRLRKRSREALGERFDLRDFHERVLEDGTIPLGALSAKIDRWLAAGAPSALESGGSS